MLKNGLKIQKDIFEKLYPHQQEGIKWLYDAVHIGKAMKGHTQRIKCGLLSDDMGVGKTIQVI